MSALPRKLDKATRLHKQDRVLIAFRKALYEPTKAELRQQFEQSWRNTAQLPVCADGLKHNAGEGES